MNYSQPITYRSRGKLTNPKTKRTATNLLWSFACPVIMLLLAEVLSMASSAKETGHVVGLFLIGNGVDNLTNVMAILRTLVMTMIAALALNTNLNSGRMDFALGATGVLACLFSALIIGSDISTPEKIFAFLGLAILFGMVLGLIHSFVLILTKLPPIVISLGMCLVYEGIAKVVAVATGSTGGVNLASGSHTTSFFAEPIILFPLLLIVGLIMAAALCYTRYGYNKLALVYNQKISVDTGINEILHCVVSFIIAGALIAIYQVMTCCGTASISISINLGSSGTVFKNFLPIFIGGIIARYNNQIIGLFLGCFSTTVLYTFGLDNAAALGIGATISNLINGFSVFAVLVYMVDKQRFINWVKMKRYIALEKRLNPAPKKEAE